MISSVKRFNVVLVLAVVLVLMLLQVPKACSAESTAPEKALTFLTDVAKLDLTKYDVELVGVHDLPSDLGSPAQKVVKYNLTAAGSKTDVLCIFRNDALVHFRLNVIEGSPLFTQPVTNVLDAAKGLVQRYQTYSEASYLQAMRNMLAPVAELKPMTTTSGNVKLKISTEGTATYVEWIYTINDLDVRPNSVCFIFDNGAFRTFSDSWDLYKVGSADVNISKEKAISIAREHVQKHSYKVGNITVSNFAILDEHVFAELTMQPRESFTLYPHWEIRLPLDKVYPGSVTGFQVLVWADTGEVAYIVEIGSYGAPSDVENPTTIPTGPPADGSTGQTNLDPTPVMIAIPIVLAIILGLAFYRKRKD